MDRGLDKAVVVGSGPNGLACAVELAGAGLDVTVLEAADTFGGGTRSGELEVPGLIHDYCSAFHPMGVASPFLRSLDLGRHGLEWCYPEIDLAHPLDGGDAGVMYRSIEETARGLGEDGKAWRRIFEAPSKDMEALGEDIFRPLIHIPRHPVKLTRFGLAAAQPAALLAKAWKSERAKALFGGQAAHAIAPLTPPLSSSVGVALISAGHAYGFPVAKGGSQSIANALVAELEARGGRVQTGVTVRTLADLPSASTVVFDLAPSGVARICGDQLPSGVAKAYRRYKHGPAAFKLDLAVEGGVPWTNEACRRAGTVHVMGSFAEIVAAERDVARGRMPERPLLLVGQQYLADPSRSAGDVHPIWSYAHVPNGWEGDATEAMLDQIERFAPGLRERIVAKTIRSAPGFASYNANYVGGDIITGANTPWQLVFRPRVTLNPYSTGIPGHFICSAATPPGGGIQGMNGYNAARVALKELGLSERPGAGTVSSLVSSRSRGE